MKKARSTSFGDEIIHSENTQDSEALEFEYDIEAAPHQARLYDSLFPDGLGGNPQYILKPKDFTDEKYGIEPAPHSAPLARETRFARRVSEKPRHSLKSKAFANDSMYDIEPAEEPNIPREAAFAGRLGGNQQYVRKPESPAAYEQERARAPDAFPNARWRDILNLKNFNEIVIWKSAVLEFWGQGMLTFVSGAAGFTLGNMQFSSPIVPLVVGALINQMSLTLFIYAGMAPSGAHINSLMTMSTLFSRLASLPRATVYILAQLAGSTAAASLLKIGVGAEAYFNTPQPGCHFDPALVTRAQAYTLEVVSCIALVYIAFGVGMDPRQAKVFGPALAPLYIGTAIALMTLVTGALRPGYLGASMNPSRCFGLLAAQQKFQGHWVQWAGAITAAGLNGILYNLIPPYHAENKVKKNV